MAQLIHPPRDAITLAGVLSALADPARLKIVKGLAGRDDCPSCTEAMPCPGMAKSTLSHHFRVLRDAGLIQTSKRGVEYRNAVRVDDIETRFPGLLETLLRYSD